MQATGQEVGVSALTGLLVGLLVVAGMGRRWLALVSPLLASVVVSAVVLELADNRLTVIMVATALLLAIALGMLVAAATIGPSRDAKPP